MRKGALAVEAGDIIVFDEFSPAAFMKMKNPVECVKKFLDRQHRTSRKVEIRYDVAELPAGVGMIITTNAHSLQKWLEEAGIFVEETSSHYSAIARKCEFVHVTECLSTLPDVHFKKTNPKLKIC